MLFYLIAKLFCPADRQTQQGQSKHVTLLINNSFVFDPYADDTPLYKLLKSVTEVINSSCVDHNKILIKI